MVVSDSESESSKGDEMEEEAGYHRQSRNPGIPAEQEDGDPQVEVEEAQGEAQGQRSAGAASEGGTRAHLRE